jgi:hypothetical protein
MGPKDSAILAQLAGVPPARTLVAEPAGLRLDGARLDSDERRSADDFSVLQALLTQE